MPSRHRRGEKLHCNRTILNMIIEMRNVNEANTKHTMRGRALAIESNRINVNCLLCVTHFVFFSFFGFSLEPEIQSFSFFRCIETIEFTCWLLLNSNILKRIHSWISFHYIATGMVCALCAAVCSAKQKECNRTNDHIDLINLSRGLARFQLPFHPIVVWSGQV